MTNNATQKQIADVKAYLESQRLNLDAQELAEKIRANKAQEYLKHRGLEQSKAQTIISGIEKMWGTFVNKPAEIVGGIMAKSNDESWHNKDSVMYDQATNLPFTMKAGQVITKLKASELASELRYVTGGIATVGYIPTYQFTSTDTPETSQMQNIAKIFFKEVRRANSGAVNNYDAADLMQFTMCASSFAEVLTFIMRPIRYMHTAKRTNPMNIITAWDIHVLTQMCGGDAAAARNFIENEVNIIQAINNVLNSYNAAILPIGFDLTKRRNVLNGNVFKHSKLRDELYLFVPIAYYIYDETNSKAVCTRFDFTKLRTTTGIKDLLNSILQPLVNGTASAIMSGDIGKAYPNTVTEISKIPVTFEDDVFSDNEEILESLRNGVSITDQFQPADDSSYFDYSQFDIKQGISSLGDEFLYTGTYTPGFSPAVTMTFKESAGNEIDTNNYTDYNDGAEAIMFCEISDTVEVSDRTKAGAVTIYDRQRVIDFKMDSPAKYDIMCQTRFVPDVQVDHTLTWTAPNAELDYAQTITRSDNTIHIYECGSEVLTGITVKYFGTVSDVVSNTFKTASVPARWHNYIEVFANNTKSALARFHYIPWGSYFECDSIADLSSGEYSIPDFVCHVRQLNVGRFSYLLREFEQTELFNLNSASFVSLIKIEPQVSQNFVNSGATHSVSTSNNSKKYGSKKTKRQKRQKQV